jgi:predicted nucleic-acid-binding protein
MIGLDTNILVRYLTQDDPIQSPPRPTGIIERHLTEQNPGFVSVVAMVETAWVHQFLRQCYRSGKYLTWPSHSPGLLHSERRIMSSTADRTVT